MTSTSDLSQSWAALPNGARLAFEEQWAALAAKGLPCGSSITDVNDQVIVSGRNHSYDPVGAPETYARYPLQHNRLAHAELNALAKIPTETDHVPLILWTTQHPCSMCAAAMAFIGLGHVRYIADDPSDHASADTILATRAGVPYQSLGDPLWWTVSNLLFLYNSAVLFGADANNLKSNRECYPQLVTATLTLAKGDPLGLAARSGATLVQTLEPHYNAILQLAEHAPK
jgi:tRNA(Arg) A34 adenosine deaminase TadA